MKDASRQNVDYEQRKAQVSYFANFTQPKHVLFPLYFSYTCLYVVNDTTLTLRHSCKFPQ